MNCYTVSARGVGIGMSVCSSESDYYISLDPGPSREGSEKCVVPLVSVRYVRPVKVAEFGHVVRAVSLVELTEDQKELYTQSYHLPVSSAMLRQYKGGLEPDRDNRGQILVLLRNLQEMETKPLPLSDEITQVAYGRSSLLHVLGHTTLFTGPSGACGNTETSADGSIHVDRLLVLHIGAKFNCRFSSWAPGNNIYPMPFEKLREYVVTCESHPIYSYATLKLQRV